MTEAYERLLGRMVERYTQLTGFAPDDASDIGIRLKVLAEELGILYETATRLREEVFPQTSSGIYLERHAQTRGLTRKGGVAAVGVLRFSRSTAPGVDLPVPEGTICSTATDPICRYVTTGAGVLKAGETWVDLPARAAQVGSGSNAAQGSVVVMVTPVGQMGGVSNPIPFTGGMDAEDDESLRERLLESYKVVSNGTNSASYLQRVLGYDGITDAKVLPRKRGVGTVDIVITSAGQPPAQALMEEIRRDLAGWKEINVDIALYPAKVRTIPLRLAVEVREGEQFATLAGELQAALLRFSTLRGVGEPLRLAGLLGLMMGDSRVVNCHILEPVADVAAGEDEVLLPGTITLTPLEGS